MTINERLFLILAKSGRTQKALADAIGVNERNIATWKMRGTDPPAKYACQIAAFLGVSVEWLLTGEDRGQTSIVNNGSVSGNLGPNSGSVHVINDGGRILSAECAELVRVYESLCVRDRIRLLDVAFKIADGAESSAPAPAEKGAEE